MVRAMMIATFQCFRAALVLNISLVTLTFKCCHAAIVLSISLVTLVFKGCNAVIVLIISSVTLIFKGCNAAILLINSLVTLIFKGCKAAILAIATIFKCFKAVVIVFICMCKFFKKAVTKRDVPGMVPNSPQPPSITSSSDVILQIYPENREPHVGSVSMEGFLKMMAREKPIRFSVQQLATIAQNYSTKLGSGSFGDVYKGELEDGLKVAVKVLKQDLDKKVHQQFMAEIGTIGRTYHVNLVKLYGFCFTPITRALVYEYMENGSLDAFLFGQHRLTEWGKLQDIAIGIAKAISYLHEECHQVIIHYDIKPENVLLDANLNPKVADFGLAQLCNIGSSQVTLTSCRGTPGYVAPEIWMPYPVTPKCDVYSFGMLLFEIVGRRRNLDLNTVETQEWLPGWVWDMFARGELLEMVSMFGIEERDREKAGRMCMVALWCVQYAAEARPIMSTVVRMLEGVIEIPRPPNPFEHMKSNEMNFFAAYASSYLDSEAIFSTVQGTEHQV